MTLPRWAAKQLGFSRLSRSNVENVLRAGNPGLATYGDLHAHDGDSVSDITVRARWEGLEFGSGRNIHEPHQPAVGRTYEVNG